MAQQTTIRATALPGGLQSFVAKTQASSSTSEGLQFGVDEIAHYTLSENRAHYTMETNRGHYTMRDET